jgi:hypothetical protein
MSLILNPLNTDVSLAASALEKGLVCFSGDFGSGKDQSLLSLMDRFDGAEHHCGTYSVVGETRSENHVWELESALETDVVLTTIQGSDVLDAIFALYKLKASSDLWAKVGPGSVFSCQTLVASLEGMDAVSYAEVAEKNASDAGFADLMVRIEKAANGRSTAAIRFANPVPPDNEVSAVIQGILMGSPGDEESNRAWNEFRKVNPAVARQIRPIHFVASEVLVVDEKLHALLVKSNLVEIRNYVQALNIQTQKSHAIDQMLQGNIDPSEVELAFGWLN